jgi:hypothetical protein
VGQKSPDKLGSGSCGHEPEQRKVFSADNFQISDERIFSQTGGMFGDKS